MGFPTVFIVPAQTDQEKLKERLAEWNATYVQNTAQFKPDHPEQTTIETNSILCDQNNQKFANSKSEEKQRLDKQGTGLSGEGVEKEQILLKFAGEGWYFRLKEVKNKCYLCVRKSKEEHSLGLFTNEIKYITEKNKIKIKRYKEK
jgi:tyrosyl-tRNA synthetase